MHKRASSYMICELRHEANYLVDSGAEGIIVDVEATPAGALHEVIAAKIMVERVEDCFALAANIPSGLVQQRLDPTIAEPPVLRCQRDYSPRQRI